MKLRSVASLIAVVLAAGCSGSGGGGQAAAPIPVASAAGAPAPQSATLTFSFQVPSAQARRPDYISPNSKYFSSTIVGYNGLTSSQFPIWLAPTTLVGLKVGGNCQVSGSTETCTVVVPTYPGRVTYTFSVLSGTKVPLATVTGLFVVNQGQNTTLNFTLQGIPDSFTITPLPSLESHVPAFVVLSTLIEDPSGAKITSSTLASPIELTDNDTSGATSLSLYATGAKQSSVVIPGATTPVKLNYTGLAIKPFTLTAMSKSTGFTTATITITPVVDPIQLYGPIPDAASPSDPNYGLPTIYINSATTTTAFTVQQPGWSNSPYSKTFTAALDPTSCNGVATISSTDNLKFLVKPVGNAGICKITMTGGAGSTAVLYAAVTISSIGINGHHR